MKSITIDRRTSEQRITHTRAVVAHDTGMSGLGDASGMRSLAAWAMGPDADPDAIRAWVRSRGGMRDVRVVDLGKYIQPAVTHLTIYAVRPGHPATLSRGVAS